MLQSPQDVNLDLHERAERAEAEVARLREALEAVEWVDVESDDGNLTCPWCGGWRPDADEKASGLGGHKLDCQWQVSLSTPADIKGMED